MKNIRENHGNQTWKPLPQLGAFGYNSLLRLVSILRPEFSSIDSLSNPHFPLSNLSLYPLSSCESFHSLGYPLYRNMLYFLLSEYPACSSLCPDDTLKISLVFFPSSVFLTFSLKSHPLSNQPGDPSSLPSSEYPACSSRMSLQTLQKLTSPQLLSLCLIFLPSLTSKKSLTAFPKAKPPCLDDLTQQYL